MAMPTKENSPKINGSGTSSTSSYGSEMRDVGSSIERLVTETGERVGHVASEVANRSSDYAKKTSEYVKENPGKGLLWAAVGGMVFAFLMMIFIRPRR